MAKFNPALPFGSIYPPVGGATKWQNGAAFDADNNHVDMNTGKIIEAAGKAQPLKTKQPKKDKPVAEALGDPDPETDPESGEGEGDPEATSDVVNLTAWAKGEAGINWFVVKKAMEDEGYVVAADMTAEEARAAILAKAEA